MFKNEESKTITLQPLNTELDKNTGRPIYEPITFTEEQIENLPVKIIGKYVQLIRRNNKNKF